jgi:hypothetical protein
MDEKNQLSSTKRLWLSILAPALAPIDRIRDTCIHRVGVSRADL